MGFLTGISTVISLALILSVYMIDTYNRTSFQTMQEARMRSYINSLETQIRLILLDPNSYVCTAGGGVANCRLSVPSDYTASGSSSSTAVSSAGAVLKSEALAATEKIRAAFLDQPQGICQFNLTSCQLGLFADPILTYSSDGTRPSVQLKIGMSGNPRFAPVKVEVNPSPEIFQTRSFRCEGFLTGFNPDGSPICQTISRNRAPAGSYVSSVNMNTLEPSFAQLPGDINDCANDSQFLQSYEWLGGAGYNATCSTRLSPFLFGGG